MPATYEPIATTTLGSAAATITFSSIPATYTDLRLVLVAQGSAATDIYLRFNSDSGTNYSVTSVYGAGTSALSNRTTSAAQIIVNPGVGISTSPNWSLATIDIFSYAGSTNKSVLAAFANDKNGTGSIENIVGLWRNTAAITRIDLSGSTYTIGTTATLYGIKAA